MGGHFDLDDYKPAIASAAGRVSAGRRKQGAAAPIRGDLAKAAFDRIFALAALIFFLPFFLLIALAIKLSDGGPVFYRHRRIGRGGESFGCLKFRTMATDSEARLNHILATDPVARAEWSANRKLDPDPRVTCLGEFFRKTSLDELPQFWNVLMGQMSVVGPRPIVAEEAVRYGEHFADYLSVRPGVTGLWQVSGRSNTSYAERVALDVRYVRSRSFLGDLRIILRTVAVMLRRDGAC